MKILAIIVAFLLMSGIALAAPCADPAGTCYVRPGGHDTNCNGNVNVDDSEGVRPECAYKTVDKAQGEYQTNGTIYLQPGKIFRECGNPINLWRAGGTITSDASNRAQLRCSTLVHGTIGDDTVTATWTNVSGSIYSTPVADLRNAYTAWLDTNTPLTKAGDASLTGAGQFFPDTDADILYVWTTDGTSPAGHTIEVPKDTTVLNVQVNSTVSNIRVLHGDYNENWAGIFIYGGTYASTVVSNCEVGPTFGWGIYALAEAGKTFSGLTITGNYVHHNWNGAAYGSGGAGGGIQTSGGDSAENMSGVVISKNRLEHNYLDIINNYAKDTHIYQNIGYLPKVDGILHYNGTEDHPVLIYNNSWIMSPANSVNGHAYTTQNNGDHATLKNNLCVIIGGGADTHCFVAKSNSQDGIVMDYNVYYDLSGTAHVANWEGAANRDNADIAAWRTDTGQEANTIFADPALVSTTIPDFHLQSGSAAINAGTNLSFTTDYEGNPVPKGGTPDAGAYEKSLGGLMQSFGVFNKFAPHRRLH